MTGAFSESANRACTEPGVRIPRIARQQSCRIDRVTHGGNASSKCTKRITGDANIYAGIGISPVGIGDGLRPCRAQRHDCAEGSDQCRGHQAADDGSR